MRLSLFSLGRAVAALSLLALAAIAPAQNLTVGGFVPVLVPQHMANGSTTRLPIIFRARVTGLTASTTYRYFNNMGQAADIGTTNPGAGNPLFIDSTTGTFTYSTGASLTTANNYGTFTTDASGEFEGWFGIVNTGNARFNALNVVFPTLVIGDNTGTLLERRAMPNDATAQVTVLAWGAAAANGTGLQGTASAATVPSQAKDMVAVYGNTAGTGRPLGVTFINNASIGGAAVASLVAWYNTNVLAQPRVWGTIIPNTLASGIQRIERRSLATGAILDFSTDADGAWGSGANTVNPTGGTTQIVTTSADAQLPVELSSFLLE